MKFNHSVYSRLILFQIAWDSQLQALIHVCPTILARSTKCSWVESSNCLFRVFAIRLAELVSFIFLHRLFLLFLVLRKHLVKPEVSRGSRASASTAERIPLQPSCTRRLWFWRRFLAWTVVLLEEAFHVLHITQWIVFLTSAQIQTGGGQLGEAIGTLVMQWPWS